MSGFLPRRARGAVSEPEHPRLHQRPIAPAEQRARWEVRAAQWRAREIAEAVFGGATNASLHAVRPHGPLRGLLRLTVPFGGLELHREREQRFLAAAQADPILAQIPLVYVFGPDVG